jgi:hypothetical protein
MKEEIYDEQIFPLMRQIIDICKKNKIALISSFHLDEDLSCTTALLTDEYDPTEKQIKAYDVLKPKEKFSSFHIIKEIK